MRSPGHNTTDGIPTIDVSALWGADLGARREVAAAMGDACRRVGFFEVTGHGIPQRDLDRVFREAASFFALPLGEQEALGIERSRHNRGYVGMGAEALNPQSGPDRKEAFHIGTELPETHPDVVAGLELAAANVWPNLPGFSEFFLAHFQALLGVARQLHRGLALDLGLEESFFEPYYTRPMAALRLLRYPAASEDNPAGCGVHSDYGGITLLAQQGVPGLEVQDRSGRWVPAPANPGALLCNLGDLMQRWTGDVYVSTPHRVRHREAVPRLSAAFFCDPNPDAQIETVCASPVTVYPPIRAADHLTERLDATYAFRRGESPDWSVK